MKGGESLCTTYQGRAWKSRCVHGVGSRLQTEDALCFSSLKRERSAGLPFESFQLLSHVCAADLGVASRGPDGRSAFHGDMAKIVIEGTTGFIEQINITELLPFVPHM